MVAGSQPFSDVRLLFRYLFCLLLVTGAVGHAKNATKKAAVATDFECPAGKIAFKLQTFDGPIIEFSRKDWKSLKESLFNPTSQNGFCDITIEWNDNDKFTYMQFNLKHSEQLQDDVRMAAASGGNGVLVRFRFTKWEHSFFHRIEEAAKLSKYNHLQTMVADMLKAFRYTYKQCGITMEPPRSLKSDENFVPGLVMVSTSTSATTTTTRTTTTLPTSSRSTRISTSSTVALSTVEGSTVKTSTAFSTSVVIPNVHGDSEQSTSSAGEVCGVPIYLIVLIVLSLLSALSAIVWALCVTIRFKKFKRQSHQTIEDLNGQLQNAQESRATSESQTGGVQSLLNTATTERDEARERVKELEQDVNRKKTDNETLENRNKELEAELKKMKDGQVAGETRTNTKKEDLVTLETRTKELQDTKDELQKARMELQDARKDLQYAKEKNEELTQELKNETRTLENKEKYLASVNNYADKNFRSAIEHEYTQHENVLEAKTRFTEIDRLYKKIRAAQKTDPNANCEDDHKELEMEMKALSIALERSQNTFLRVYNSDRVQERTKYLQEEYDHFLLNKNKMTENAQNTPRQKPRDERQLQNINKVLMMYQRKQDYWERMNKKNRDNEESISRNLSEIGSAATKPANPNNQNKTSKKGTNSRASNSKNSSQHSKHSVIDSNAHLTRNGQANMRGSRSRSSTQNTKNVQTRRLHSPPDK